MSLFSCTCGVLLTFLGVALLGVAGLSGLASGFPQTGELATVMGLVFITLGAVSFVSGLGLFRVSVWAWWLSLATFLSTTIITVVGGLVAPFLINLLGVTLLLAVRKRFGVSRPRAPLI